MPDAWFDQAQMKKRLVGFFDKERAKTTTFGNTVNQTFEAFVFAALVAWYRKQGWFVKFKHPNKKQSTESPNRLFLKFSTRGRPDNYSYAIGKKGKETIQIHHQLRVATRHHREPYTDHANVCLDVAVIRESDVTGFGTDDSFDNGHVLTFGEAKHMSAFAELVAGFIGLVHEMMPEHVKERPKAEKRASTGHLAPFLFVSGDLYKSARGIIETMQRRNMTVQVFSCTKDLTDAFKLHEGHFNPEILRAWLKAKAKKRNAAKREKAEQEEKLRQHKQKELKKHNKKLDKIVPY